MSDLHSNFSEGMSVLFASLKQLQKKQTTMVPDGKDADVAPSSAPSERRLSAKMSAISPDFLDEDLGDPPDFFDYALRIAAKAHGNIQEEAPEASATSALERRNSEDSLAHLELDELSELFHPPLRGDG